MNPVDLAIKKWQNQIRKESLFNAAMNGNCVRVKELLLSGRPTEQRNKKGVTPLGIAAAKGNLGTVELLLNHGACVNAVIPQNGYTPLYFAAENGHYDVEKLLLKNGGACWCSKPRVSKGAWRSLVD